MTVFDVARNQYLPRPVSAYHRGRALRGQMEAQEINNEMGRRDLETYDARLQDARKKEERIQADQDVAHQEKFLAVAGPAIKAGNRDAVQALADRFFPGDDPLPDDAWEELQAAFPEDPFEYKGKETYIGEDGREYLMLIGKDGELEQTDIPLAPKGSLTEVNINGDESAMDKEFGKIQARRLGEMGDRAVAAKSQLSNLDMFEAALDEGAQTGTLQPALVYAKGAMEDLGFEFDETSDLPLQEQIQSLEITGALGKIQDTKGPISDREMDMFIRSVPNLAKSEEGNRLMIEFLRWKNQLTIQHYELAKSAKDPDAFLKQELKMPKALLEKIREVGEESTEEGGVVEKEFNGKTVRIRKVGG